MRQLVLLRGAMASGKSTWVKENGLEDYTLSADKIRAMASGYSLTEDGNVVINSHNEKFVWDTLMLLLENRMQDGAFTIIDATHVKREAINRYKELADKYRYRVYVLEFEAELDELLERNRQRPPHQFVPEHVIANAIERLKNVQVPNWVTRTTPENFYQDVFWRISDYTDKYESIVVIGDIHGSYDVLMEMLKFYQENSQTLIDPNKLYIFVGDYLDRGTQNYETFRLLQSIIRLKNVIPLHGNHENHLMNFAYSLDDDEYKPKGGFKQTHYDLTAHNTSEIKAVTEKESRDFVRSLQQLAYFKFNDNKFLVTHAGLGNFNRDNLSLINTQDMIFGAGGYETNIDEIYSNHQEKLDEKDRTYQIHGHRNMFGYPTHAKKYSYNLENSVEHGGNLRTVFIDGNDIHPYSFKNNNFNPVKKEKIELDMSTISVEEFLDNARDHKYINVIDNAYDTVSVNFTVRAFNRRKWDDITITARGLFINTMHNEIIARGYEKFFNYGEKTNSSSRYMRERIVYPVNIYTKYNGFLGLISYDKFNDKLRFFTKRFSSDTEYENNIMAPFFEQRAYDLIDKDKLNKIKEVSKERNCTFVFELVDNKNDPHIVESDTQMILLDMIDNTVQFNKADYKTLTKTAMEIGLEVKMLDYTFNNWTDLFEWIIDVQKNEEIRTEGYVLEDSDGFMVKFKSLFYNRWKKLRGIVDMIKKGRYYEINHSLLYDREETEFISWCKKSYDLDPDKFKEANIIELRRDFYRNKIMEKIMLYE